MYRLFNCMWYHLTVCFWELKINGWRTAPTILQSSMRCSYMLPQKDGKRWNSTSAKASGGKCPSWTQRQIYLPFSWCNPKPAGRNSLIFTWRSTSCTGYLAPHQESWPFWRRYQLPSLATQWRKKTILMLQNSLISHDLHPPRSRLPQHERESLLDRSLARVCEVHWKALLAAATLEEEMERLYWMRACSHTKWRHRDRDSQESGKRRKKRWCQVGLSSQPVTSWSASPDMLHGRMGSEGED